MCIIDFIRNHPTDCIIAIAASIQAGFAFALWMVTKKVDQSNKSMNMITEYYSLSKTRDSFWDFLTMLYGRFKKIEYDQAANVIKYKICSDGYPDPDPFKVHSLLAHIRKNESKWEQLSIWQFAKSIVSSELLEYQSEPHVRHVYESFEKLVGFWNKWCIVLDFSKSIEPDIAELIILSWIELAFVSANEDKVKSGEQPFLKLARDRYKHFKSNNPYNAL